MDNPNYHPENPSYPPAQQSGYPASPAQPPGYYPAPPAQPPHADYPPAQQGYPAQQPPPATFVTVTQPSTQAVVVGGCPVCHTGNLVDNFTTCGIILAICFFPIGIICCLMMKERSCNHCGAHFGG